MTFIEPQIQIDTLGLNPGNVVIDLGAGSGVYSILAAKAVTPRGTVYAVDLHQDLLTRLKRDASEQGLSNLDVIWGDVEVKDGVKLTSHIADAILICNTLFMAEDKEGLLSEVNRLLKINGKVLVVEWNDSHEGVGPHPSHIFYEQDAKNLFIKNGFEISNASDDTSYHYRFVATKTI